MNRMQRRTRTITQAVALAAVALLLAACGRPAGVIGTVESDSVDDAPATGTLTVWAMGGEGENLPALAEVFEEQNPGVSVSVTPVPWQSAHDKLANSIAAGQTPDMAMVGTTWMAEFAAAGGLRPVPENLVDPDAFFPGNQRTTEYLDASYGVPWYADARILIYRADLAAEAGVEAPATWDDYDAFNEALADIGVDYGTYLQSGGDGTTNMFLPFVWQAGGAVMNDDETEFTLDTPEVREALEYYVSLFDRGFTPVESQVGLYQTQFLDGTIGSYVSGPYEIAQVRALAEDAGQDPDEMIGVAPMPAGEQAGAFVGGADLGVFTTAKNPDAAWKFIRFLSETGVQQDWYDITTDLPAVPEAWESGTLAEDELFSSIRESIEAGTATPQIVTWQQVDDLINREVEKVVRGVSTVEEATAAMQQKASLIGTGK